MENANKLMLPVLGGLMKLTDIAQKNKSSPSLKSLRPPGPVDDISLLLFQSLRNCQELQRGMYTFYSSEEFDEGLLKSEMTLNTAKPKGRRDRKNRISGKTIEPEKMRIKRGSRMNPNSPDDEDNILILKSLDDLKNSLDEKLENLKTGKKNDLFDESSTTDSDSSDEESGEVTLPA